MYLVWPSFADLFGFGAAATNNNVKFAEIQFLESSNAQDGKKLMQFAKELWHGL